MKKLIYFLIPLIIFSCKRVERKIEKEKSELRKSELEIEKANYKSALNSQVPDECRKSEMDVWSNIGYTLKGFFQFSQLKDPCEKYQQVTDRYFLFALLKKYSSGF